MQGQNLEGQDQSQHQRSGSFSSTGRSSRFLSVPWFTPFNPLFAPGLCLFAAGSRTAAFILSGLLEGLASEGLELDRSKGRIKNPAESKETRSQSILKTGSERLIPCLWKYIRSSHHNVPPCQPFRTRLQMNGKRFRWVLGSSPSGHNLQSWLKKKNKQTNTMIATVSAQDATKWLSHMPTVQAQ